MAEEIAARIGVENMDLYIRKGIHDAEKLLENHFRISARVDYRYKDLEANTYLDYEKLAEILEEEMKRDIDLLETIAGNILERIMREWTQAGSAWVSIKKMHPALEGSFIESVLVEMEIRR